MDKANKLDLRGKLGYALQRIPGGAVLFAVLALVVLGYFGWFYYGADHLDRALYSLKLENLTVTPQPAWIKSNVADEVFSHGRLDRISLLEPRAGATIAQAFETHNWVKSATRVSKAAGGTVIVDLVYRRPAAMVYYNNEVADPDNPGQLKRVEGFFPIDEAGIVLPPQDFASDDVWEYFIISAEDARPAGDVGMPYGDVRIMEALKLCELLEKHREPYQLQEIWVSRDTLASGPSPWTLVISTRDKREIVWGPPPNDFSGEELPALEKIDRMLAWLKRPRSNRNEAINNTLDLRQGNPGTPVSSFRR